MRILKYIYLLFVQLSLGYGSLLAQTELDSLAWYQLQIDKDLPLEEAALNPEELFYIANRHLDSLKTLAMQVNVLTEAEIRNAGVTNIPEALQLLPEFTVKAKSNGIYQVEYRGTSAISSEQGSSENLLLLINAQPFNDALSGEIWWEALPFTVDDLKRIELIRSPQGTWFGYGGALAVINMVTHDPSQIKGTQFNATLQAGNAGTHHYHVGLGMQVNEKLSGRIGAYFHRRNRFQTDYYVRSRRRYVPYDSVLFYQPEALLTNPIMRQAQQSRGFSLSSAYQWSERVYLRLDAASQNSRAQAPFLLNEELKANTRTAQTQTVNIRFRSPSLEAQAFYFGGNQDLASGYAGMQYLSSRTGLRAAYRKKVGRYSLTAGTEWLSQNYQQMITAVSGLVLSDSLQTLSAWEENLISVYLQQKAGFLDDRLLIESGQRIYQFYQGLDFPLGYHVALRWFLNEKVSVQAGAARTIQASNQVFGSNHLPLQLRSYNLGVSRQINRKQGSVRFSLFSQQGASVSQLSAIDTTDYAMPLWGSTLEANYSFGRLSLSANGSWFESSRKRDTQLHPSLVASLQANYATYFDKLNLHLGFFYNSMHQNIVDGIRYEIPEQWLLNSRISYRVWKNHQLFINARNLLNNKQYYVPHADPDYRLLMFGVNIAL